MNREILFRGFHKDKNGTETIYLDGKEIKGEWVYGNLAVEHNKTYIFDTRNGYLESVREVLSETVGQYIGLDDKNNKRIFEDDVIKSTEYLKPGEIELFYKVEYIERLAKYALNPIIKNGKYDNNNFELDMFYYKKEDIEVIGTIFDQEVK